jgi:hypothetical protein
MSLLDVLWATFGVIACARVSSAVFVGSKVTGPVQASIKGRTSVLALCGTPFVAVLNLQVAAANAAGAPDGRKIEVVVEGPRDHADHRAARIRCSPVRALGW